MPKRESEKERRHRTKEKKPVGQQCVFAHLIQSYHDPDITCLK